MPCRYAVVLIYDRAGGPVAAFADRLDAERWARAEHGRLAEVIDLQEDTQCVNRTSENEHGTERVAEGA